MKTRHDPPLVAARTALQAWPALRVVTGVVVLVLLFLAVTGLLADLSDDFLFFHLDEERASAAALSSFLLLGAGVAVAMAHARSGAGPLAYALPLLLVFMAIDEFLVLHEPLEQRVGVDWQILYSPLILAAGAAWLLVLRRWGPRSLAGMLLILGAVAWAFSQLLEFLQWDGDVPRPGYGIYVVVEELAEAGGSACFLLAGAVAFLGVGTRTQQKALPPHDQHALLERTAHPSVQARPRSNLAGGS